MSQHTKILNLLKNGEWICSSRFYAEYIADPRSRIAELKKKGYQLEWRWCKSHDYHTGQQKEWKLISRGGLTTGRLAHNQEIAGLIPAPATRPITETARIFLAKWNPKKEPQQQLNF